MRFNKPRYTLQLVSRQTSEQSLAERLKRIEDALSHTLSNQKNSENTAAKPLTPTSLATDPHKSSDPGTGDSTNDTPQKLSFNRPSSSFLRATDSRSASVSQGSPFISQAPSPAGGFTSSVSYGQLHYGGCHFGHISQHNGLPLLSEEGRQWIISKTGHEVILNPGATDHSKPSQSPAPHVYHDQRDLYELPDRSITEKAFDAFIHSSFSLVFPIVERVLFKDTIELAYQPYTGDGPSLEHLSAKVGVLAFLSTIVLFQETFAASPTIDTDLCATKARYLLTDVLEIASINNLQIVFMLNMHEIFSGRLRSGAMFHAIACRMVFTLGGHTNISYIALRTGQPPLMSDEYCDLTLPETYYDCYEYLPKLNESLPQVSFDEESLMPHLPGDPRLSQLKDKTSRLLYSAQAAKKSHAQLLCDIRELDEELEAWRQSLPPSFRPALSITNESQVALQGMHLPRSMRHITLHLDYHHLMIAIHRASGRCMEPDPGNHKDQPEWVPGVESSNALALEASRSTLVYLRAAMCGVAGEAFWVIVFYPTAAMITLFFNILLYPLHERAEQDLELLKAAADLINNLPVRRLTTSEVSHMKLINDFVVELARLGRSAICKATMEKDQELDRQLMIIH
ncbi:Mut3p-like transcriptional activator [Fusarium globosum]|uniref:Mut3p-like transcriptional activator n=1 Tax=Fusarium globosum TaxID=78864 RepID=A0A8H5XVL5_9HYPO|nr:Mut3p-like transcriptional activator [Fusarium globosum]